MGIYAQSGNHIEEYVSIGDSLADKTKYIEAIPYYEFVYHYYQETEEKDDKYLDAIYSLAISYSETGKNLQASLLCSEALEITKDLYSDFDIKYIESLLLSSDILKKISQYDEAKELCEQAILLTKNKYGIECETYSDCLSKLASLYAKKGKYDLAIDFGNKALNILKKIYGTEHEKQATVLNNIATFYSEKGTIAEAIRLGTEASKIYKNILGINHPLYIKSLINIAVYNSQLGDYNSAIMIEKQILSEYFPNYNSDDINYNSNYLTVLNNLASDYANINNYNEAIIIEQKIINYIENQIEDNNIAEYVVALNNMGSFHEHIYEYNKAADYFKRNLPIIEKVYGKYNKNYVTTLGNLAECMFDVSNHEQAFYYINEALQIDEIAYGRNNPHKAKLLRDLSNYYYIKGEINKMDSCWIEAMEIEKNGVLSIFQGIVEQERERYWEKQKENFVFWPLFYAMDKESPIMIRAAYDASLFYKGLLLDTNLQLKEIIDNSNDSTLIGLLEEYKKNKLLLDSLYNISINERTLSTDSIEEYLIKQKRDILNISRQCQILENNRNITWKDIKNNLSEDDISIEFVNLCLTNDDTDLDLYFALILKKSFDYPKLIPLFTREMIEENSKENFYKDEYFYKLIWGQLEPELSGISNVYFSPTGVLNCFNIELLPKIFKQNDNKHYYRLTSTRQLAYEHEDSEIIADAVFIGGIDYDSSSTDSVSGNISSNYLNMTTPSVIKRINYLPESCNEINLIADDFTNKGIRTRKYIGSNATEDSFKALNNSNLSNIHISTHGFFYNEKDDTESLSIDNAGIITEEVALSRSGLLFAGCNNHLNSSNYLSEINDGILSAKEISKMSFKGLDLVSISACESGLGEISSEGVFGLQRAFKKAGTCSIIMSLWKVDDISSSMLMIQFYKNYLNGDNKQTSLYKAQQYVRNYKDEDGNKLFEDPYYWAGFILLDAIE